MHEILGPKGSSVARFCHIKCFFSSADDTANYFVGLIAGSKLSAWLMLSSKLSLLLFAQWGQLQQSEVCKVQPVELGCGHGETCVNHSGSALDKFLAVQHLLK
ncbi:predicted protein [Histoplasma capsulatum H143]|uniref:Uncharacterized protein n=1 Tax=Ajellomyces capsulatus (strain H143) TaxID=544712 RepID=C6H8W1_AJECH|nr:predicted protein [Histoplasma capsulatum H143]